MEEEHSFQVIPQPQSKQVLKDSTNANYSEKAKWEKLKQEFLKLRDQQCKQQGGKNVFILQNANQRQIYFVVKLWKDRFHKTPYNLLNLQLTNPQLSYELIKQIFLPFPSINVYYNQVKIENSAVIKSKDGVFYEGTQKNMLICSQEYQYEGEVAQGQNSYLFNGRGRYKSKTGDFVYQGEFKDGKYHGFGQLRNSKKHIHYIGQFKDDQKHGKGVQVIMEIKKKKIEEKQENKDLNEEKLLKDKKPIQKQQKKQEPQIADKRLGKKGKPTFVRKSMYDGQFIEGERSGKGIQETKYGIYDGEWNKGVKQGKGVMAYKNKDKYDGQWKNNVFHGQGIYDETGNCKYQGAFENGKYHGEGKVKYQNGDTYQGQYKQGKKQGNGVYTWIDGDYYDGEWKNDLAEGRGTSMIGTQFYDGEFSLGKRHGEGELTNEQGNTRLSRWQNGEQIQKLS